jgi:hypothetical protein
MSMEFVETHAILADIFSPGSIVIVVDSGESVGRFSLKSDLGH